MKLSKISALLSFSAICAISASIYFDTNNANAQNAAAPAAKSSRDNIPRHSGTFTAANVSETVYTPSCPTFVFDVDATAIQESRSRAFVEEQDRKFWQLQPKWEAYEDCLIENARRDIDVMSSKISTFIQGAAESEVNNFNSLNTAATDSVARVRGLPAKAKKGATPLPAVGTNYTKPEGRQPGTVTAGPVADTTYNGQCGAYMGDVNVNDFATVPTVERFNQLVDFLRLIPPRIDEVRVCRNENTQKDYDDIKVRIEAGMNAVYVPEKTSFERKYAAVRNQLNLQREAGGLLAPTSRGAPATATKAKAKKKK